MTRPKDPKSMLNLDITDLNYMEDRKGRRLFLNQDIDASVIDQFVYEILRYNREDKGKPIEERTPIKLYISSMGGSVIDGFGLIDAIITSKTPIYTINQAICASMGFLIFIAGHKRYTMPHAEFLMHDGSNMAYGSTAKMKDCMDFELGEIAAMTKEYIINHTKISDKTYKEKYRIEWYFLPETAKEYGVADFIVGKDCDIDEII